MSRAKAIDLAGPNFFQSFVEASLDCVKVLDLEGRLEFMNPAGCDLLELDDLAPHLGALWVDFWPEAQRASVQAAVNAAAGGQTIRFALPGQTYTGKFRHWDNLLCPMRDESGRIVGLMVTSRDITKRMLDQEAARERERDLKRSAAALRKARDEANAANAAKSAFLATMSHEIRTPLNGVLGMSQAMANDALSPAQQDRLNVIRQSGEALLVLLNDILDLSKIEAGKLELEDGVIDAEGLGQRARSAFEALVGDKDIAFGVTIEPAAQGRWKGDPTRVRQMLYNLIGNAVKFTERGHVDVIISRRRSHLRLQVCDSGPGIAADRLGSLFDRFVQADATTTRRYGGSGLGLAICAELAAMMGGRVDVESVVGEGSTFTVTLPATRAAGAAATPDAAPASQAADRPLKILAAEDNTMNQLVLKTLLGQVGLDVQTVNNGAEAVEAWARETWDLILMDIQMPVMDGPSAVREIRRREHDSSRVRTPIVALTANAMAHHRAEYLAAGMDALSPKPIEIGQLIRTMESLLAQDPADVKAREAAG